MNQDMTTYVERAEQHNLEAQAARLRDDAQKYSVFRQKTAAISEQALPAARLSREMGLSFQAYWLPAKADLAEAHFNAHYAPTLRMSFELFKWFISASRKLPEQIESMQDVVPSLQMRLFAGEQLALAHRTGQQASHEVAPYVFFRKQLSGLRGHLEERLLEKTDWDSTTRSSIRQEIHNTRDWLEKVEREL